MNLSLHNSSLRRRLIFMLSGITLIIWLFSIVTGWVTLRKEIHELFDNQLVFFAERLASSNVSDGFHEIKDDLSSYQAEVDDDALAFAIFTEKGDQILNDGRDGKFIQFAPQEGFQVTLLHKVEEQQNKDDIDEWRIYWLKHGDVYIAVGQETDYRQDLITEVILSQMWGWTIGFPLIIIAILWIVRRELASLKRLEQQVSKRKPDDTKAIDAEQLPSEVLPLVNSLNHYFERTHTMFNRERRFTSDAAHELRSPLAGLRIQTEIAQMTMDDPEQHQQALKNMTGGIDRISQLIEQLLTLSRLDNLEQLDNVEPIHWQRLIEENISMLYHHVEQKNTDIQFDLQALPMKELLGKPLLINLILRNLIDNAINYKPRGSVIKVTLAADHLTVEDNGDGVSDEDLAKLGQPFFRPVDRPTQATQDEMGGLKSGYSVLAVASTTG